MNRKLNIRQIADYIPLIILLVFTTISWIRMQQGNIVLQWQHYVGAVALLVNVLLFMIKPQLGVLSTGLTLILGTAGIASFDLGLVSFHAGPVSIGNPLVLLLLLAHIIISIRFYDGILTKNYWNKLFNKM